MKFLISSSERWRVRGGSKKLPSFQLMRSGYAFARKLIFGMTNFRMEAWAMAACSDGSRLIPPGKQSSSSSHSSSALSWASCCLCSCSSCIAFFAAHFLISRILSDARCLYSFLDASSHLYKRVCPSVRRSVGRSVGRSVTLELKSWKNAVFEQNKDKWGYETLD